MYVTARMMTHLPKHLEVVFNGTIFYVILASIGGTIAILITDEKRYEAIQFLACASVHLHITPFGFYTGYILITNIRAHVSTLKSQSVTHENRSQNQNRGDSTTDLKLPLKGNSTSAIGIAYSTRSPSNLKRNIGNSTTAFTEKANEVDSTAIGLSALPHAKEKSKKISRSNGNLNRRLPTGANLMWIDKLSALNSRMIYILILFGTTSVISFVVLLALGLEALNSTARYSEENERIYAESNW
eukprot:CAMPEP_0185265620 /NCGR_PEP_ID=MMETSP1359-20130426/28198_1 /TAXON_ID=552665 /ORGANISM="Bigelowiella longifila, Strain CCMP242" /LENGTH=242 /DNA_ID=CAMNT_0027855003 /DNA_START=298 /DNA_END=1023 /DNA_ORIENTATION=+